EEYIALRRVAERDPRGHVDEYAGRRVAVIRGVAAVPAEELVGTFAAHQRIVAVSTFEPVAAAIAVDGIVAVGSAVQEVDDIKVVGSIDLGHGSSPSSSMKHDFGATQFGAHPYVGLPVTAVFKKAQFCDGRHRMRGSRPLRR